MIANATIYQPVSLDDFEQRRVAKHWIFNQFNIDDGMFLNGNDIVRWDDKNHGSLKVTIRQASADELAAFRILAVLSRPEAPGANDG